MAPKLGICGANTIRAGGFALRQSTTNTVIKGGYGVFYAPLYYTNTNGMLRVIVLSQSISNAGSRISDGLQ